MPVREARIGPLHVCECGMMRIEVMFRVALVLLVCCAMVAVSAASSGGKGEEVEGNANPTTGHKSEWKKVQAGHKVAGTAHGKQEDVGDDVLGQSSSAKDDFLWAIPLDGSGGSALKLSVPPSARGWFAYLLNAQVRVRERHVLDDCSI